MCSLSELDVISRLVMTSPYTREETACDVFVIRS